MSMVYSETSMPLRAWDRADRIVASIGCSSTNLSTQAADTIYARRWCCSLPVFGALAGIDGDGRRGNNRPPSDRTAHLLISSSKQAMCALAAAFAIVNVDPCGRDRKIRHAHGPITGTAIAALAIGP